MAFDETDCALLFFALATVIMLIIAPLMNLVAIRQYVQEQGQNPTLEENPHVVPPHE